MPLRPLGHRVLVSPDVPPEQTMSGLFMPIDRDHVPVSGTVAAVGPGGPQMVYRVRQRAIKDCLAIVDFALRQYRGTLAPLLVVRHEISGLLGSADPARELHVGDRVAFAADAGLRVTEDGQEYLVMNEDDVAVVVSEAEAAA